MFRRFERALFLFLAIILLAITAGQDVHVSAQTGPDWLASTAPTIQKVGELPQAIDQTDRDKYCVPVSYTSSTLQTEQSCEFGTSVGEVTTNGRIQAGFGVYVPLRGPAASSFFIPTNSTVSLMTMPSGTPYGSYIGEADNLSATDLRMGTNAGGTFYFITKQPSNLITNPATGKPLVMDPVNVAFSTNGEWMVARLPFSMLVRVHMTDLSVMLFAGHTEPNGYAGNPNMPLAITDDGRWVAANTDVYDNNRLVVYDLTTCSDKFTAPAGAPYCNSKNIWQGNGSDGILHANPGMRLPTHLQFTADDSLGFTARYDVEGISYKTASFVATAPGGTPHGLGLLGMGDSYIAGEGAGVYHANSNTSNDHCHESSFAYPYVLGEEYFGSYNSIACSGARTKDVVTPGKFQKDQYRGQVKDHIQEVKRDEGQIFTNFDPGYIYQDEFAQHYEPQAILLSIGGNDIGFSNIITSCVASPGTCYNTYEDRAELVSEINREYGTLVKTYKDVLQQSAGAHVYVIGYPQIAQPGGACGLNVHLNAAEVEFSAELIAYLDGVIQKAAATAGVFYVDTQHAFDGHKLCEPGKPAMHGLVTQNVPHSLVPVAAESYHPTQYGYELLAQTIAVKAGGLSAPMPSPQGYQMPAFNADLAFLDGEPLANRVIQNVGYSSDLIGDVVLRGDTQQVTISGVQLQLQPGSNYQIVLHSTPVVLAGGTTDENGDIAADVQIPADTEPGYHTLHMYGTNMAGQPVDIQKIFYVSDGTEYGNDAEPATEAADTTDGLNRTDTVPHVAGANATPSSATGTASLSEDRLAQLYTDASGVKGAETHTASAAQRNDATEKSAPGGTVFWLAGTMLVAVAVALTYRRMRRH